MNPTTILTAERAAVANDDDRTRVALRILQVVATFADETAVLDTLADGDLDRIETHAGESVAQAAERLVRSLAGAAEQCTDAHGRVVCAVLAGEYLLDDYLRVRAVEQHLAFGEQPTAREDDARSHRLEELAAEAAERAAWSAARLREDARLCLCGQNYGRHVRNQARERWEPSDPGVCRYFRNVDDRPAGSVSDDLFRAGWAAWLTFHGLTAPEGELPLSDAAVRTLRQAALPVGEVYAAYAATFGLTAV